MSKKIQICFLIMLMFFVSLEAQEKITITVFDFNNNSIMDRETYQPLSIGLGQMLLSELGSLSSVSIVERQKLKSILDEIKLSQSGVIDEQTSAKAGKLLGAQYMVFGSYLVNTKGKMRLDARIVQVETGLTVKAAEATGKSGEFEKLIKNLTGKLLSGMTITMLKSEKKHLDKYRNIPLKALINFSRGLSCEDKEDWKGALSYYRKALEEAPDFEQVKKQMEENPRFQEIR